MDDPTFDYEVIYHGCEFEVEAPWKPEGVTSCDANSSVKAFWIYPNGRREDMYLCTEHFNYVYETEVSES